MKTIVFRMILICDVVVDSSIEWRIEHARMYTTWIGHISFSPILLPTRNSGTIRHLENGGNQNFTEAFVTLIVMM